jgi:hypothetical protein
MISREEELIIEEIKNYIESTYEQHYVSSNKIQLVDIIDDNDLESFAKVSSMKYIQRYGKKDGRNRKDLLKAIHYLVMMLRVDNSRKV